MAACSTKQSVPQKVTTSLALFKMTSLADVFFPNLLDLPLYIIALLVLVILTISVAHFIFLGTPLSIQLYGAGAYYVRVGDLTKTDC